MTTDRLRRLEAVTVSLQRHLNGDVRLMARRIQEWAITGLPAGGGDGRSSTIADPTGNQATARPDLDYDRHQPGEILDRAAYWMNLLDRVLYDAGRPTTATEEELQATEYVSEARARGKSSGICEACDKEATGADGNRIVHVAGFGLCNTHYKAARRDQKRGIAVADYVRSTRARLGLDL